MRTYNLLRRAEIDTVEDLADMTYSDLRKIRNMDKRGMDEIIQKLHSLGLQLKEAPSRCLA